jgi:predicted transcriptional regulator
LTQFARFGKNTLAGFVAAQLARDFGVSQSLISKIIKGKL